MADDQEMQPINADAKDEQADATPVAGKAGGSRLKLCGAVVLVLVLLGLVAAYLADAACGEAHAIPTEVYKDPRCEFRK